MIGPYENIQQNIKELGEAELMQKAVTLLKKKNQRIKWLKRDIEGYEYRSEFDYKYFTMHYRDNKRAFKELKKEKKIVEIKLKNEQKKNSILEKEFEDLRLKALAFYDANKKLKDDKIQILLSLREQEKKNTILEAENLQLWERIRALEKKIGIYAPGIKDPAHEKERGE